MKEKTIRNILELNYMELKKETFSFPFEGGVVKFVERIPADAVTDEYWLVVSVVRETSDGAVETFWKIPGTKDYCDWIELEESNAYEVTRGEERKPPVWVDTKEEISERILYPFLGYFWNKFGNSQGIVLKYERSGETLSIDDFNIDFKVVGVKEAGYDEGERGSATIEIKHEGRTFYLKIGGIYDSTEGFYWCPRDITVAKKETRLVSEWNEVK